MEIDVRSSEEGNCLKRAKSWSTESFTLIRTTGGYGVIISASIRKELEVLDSIAWTRKYKSIWLQYLGRVKSFSLSSTQINESASTSMNYIGAISFNMIEDTTKIGGRVRKMASSAIFIMMIIMTKAMVSFLIAAVIKMAN